MKKLFFLSIAVFAMTVLVSFTKQQTNADAILGSWKNSEGTGMIQIYKNGEKYQGKVTWLKIPNDPETGKPKLDKNHPDAKNHSRPILGLIVMWGFTYSGDKEWAGGKIYDNRNGKTYSCKIIMQDYNTLKIRGFIGISMIGRTDTWKRQ